MIGESFVSRILWPINGYAMYVVCSCGNPIQYSAYYIHGFWYSYSIEFVTAI